MSKLLELCVLITILSTCYLITPVKSVGFGLQLIRETVQNNIAGTPVVHQHSYYDFDPDVSKKRRPQYYDVNGFRGEKYMQRIGLGIDGNYLERLRNQENRDYGKTNGAYYQDAYALLANRQYNVHARR